MNTDIKWVKNTPKGRYQSSVALFSKTEFAQVWDGEYASPQSEV